MLPSLQGYAFHKVSWPKVYGVQLRSYWFGAIGLVSILGILIFTYLVLKGGVKNSAKKREFTKPQYERTGMGIEVISKTPPSESTFAFVGLIALIVLELYFNIIFIAGVIQGFNQNLAALSLAMAFVVWGVMLDLYRREFMPDVLIEKKRKEKAIPEREFEHK